MEKKTISEIYSLWRENKSKYVKPSTMALYAFIAGHYLLPRFGTMSEVGEEAVQDFVLDELARGMSRRSVRSMVLVLRMMVRFADKNGWMGYRKWELHMPPAAGGSSVQVLGVADQRRIMSYLDGHLSFRNLGIYICLCTGLRIGEICGLRWEDIDLAEGVMHIRRTVSRIYTGAASERRTRVVVGTPKTLSSVRDIPLNRRLLGKLRRLMPMVSGGCYVVSNSAAPVEPRLYRSYYNNLMARLGMPHTRFHALRHSFATRCVESNCDYKAVSTILGHSSITTTLNLYVHPNMEEKRKCVDKMLRGLRPQHP